MPGSINRRLTGAVSMTALGLVIQMCAAAEAAGQTTPKNEPSAASLTEVVVTASRINRAGFTAPTPVTVLTAQDLNQLGATNIGEALSQMPAFHATQTPTTNTFSRTGGGANNVDLRNLGANRTLVLVDGRRFVPSATTGVVDLNLIPTQLIERAEVVTGGASADWGSDAVAGVVNLIFKKHMNGIEGEASYGQSMHSDAKDYLLALAAGTDFAGGKGNVMAGLSYADTGKVGDIYHRDWGRKEYGILTNPTPGVNGLPGQIIAENVHLANVSYGGLVLSGPLKGTTFLPNGAVGQFNFGQVFNTQQIGGDEYGLTMYRNQLLRVPVKRFSSLARATYDFNDSLSGFVQGSWARSKTFVTAGTQRDIAPVTLKSGNPYLPASVQAAMTANRLASISVGGFRLDIPVTSADIETTAYTLTAGLNGTLAGSWRWDAYVQHGDNRVHADVQNNRLTQNYTRSLDAVTVTPANVGTSGLPIGSIACASTLTSPTNGCAPMNYFGAGSPSAASLAYILAPGFYAVKNTEEIAAANIQGEPFSTWAGPVSLAMGAEYRREKAATTSDARNEALQFLLLLPLHSQGQIQVEEFYAETVVPLIKDAPLVKQLDVSGAVREAHYSRSGWVTTWKAGLNYTPFDSDDLRFRLTRSRDIRAPNINELYLGQSTANALITNPLTRVSALTPVIAQGNLDLAPEISDTLTYGLVIQPSFIKGLRVSIDSYKIDIKNVIATFGAQNIVNQCYAGVSQYCSLVGGAGSATITSVSNQFLNLNAMHAAGVDIEGDYRIALSDMTPIPGDLTLHVLANKVTSLKTVSGLGVVTNLLSQLSGAGQPDLTVNGTATYRLGRGSLTAGFRYINGGHYSNLFIGPGQAGYSLSNPNSINDNTVPGFVYWNLAAQFDVANNVQVFGNINNLFDKSPPNVPTGVSVTNPAYYDVIGRAFRIGVRFKR